MSPFTGIRLLDVALLLPVSIALTYVTFVVFGWEQTLTRRITGARVRVNKDTNALLPVDVADTKRRKTQTWTSHIVSAAIPMAHYSITSPKLWAIGRSERISVNVCLGQIAIAMAEFVIHYFRFHDCKRVRLAALGAAWGAMALRALSLVSDIKWTDLTTSACIAILGVVSILPESPASIQASYRFSSSDMDKSGKADSRDAKVTTSRSSFIAYHLFSVSLLLVFLLHDYPSLSDKLLYRFTWLGSMSHFLLAYILLLVRDGVSNWQATYQKHQSFTRHLQAFLSYAYQGIPESLRGGFLIPLSAMGPLFGLFFLTNYMTSCLGFSRLILDQPRTKPQFLDGGVLGGFLYQMLVLVHFFLRRDKIRYDSSHKTFNFLMAVGAAFGQAVTAVVVAAAGLCIWRFLNH